MATLTNEYDLSVLTNHQQMTGTGTQATHEIHIFLGPPNPPPELVSDYKKSVEKWNEIYQKDYSGQYGDYKMKACFLCLIFRDSDCNENPVYVMQSAIYCKSNSMEEVIEQSHLQAKFFESIGFNVIREKIEATAYGINGVPSIGSELPRFLKTYFEFHIKTKFSGTNENDPITQTEVETLRKISSSLTKQFRSPVPLSYNVNKDKTVDDGLGCQRFFNVRFRELGINEIKPKLDQIKMLVTTTKNLEISKIISEYVWYDTFPNLDHGWIDFAPNEEKKLLEKVDSL